MQKAHQTGTDLYEPTSMILTCLQEVDSVKLHHRKEESLLTNQRNLLSSDLQKIKQIPETRLKGAKTLLIFVVTAGASATQGLPSDPNPNRPLSGAVRGRQTSRAGATPTRSVPILRLAPSGTRMG